MTMVQFDVFINDCEKASGMLILWEKATLSDRQRCLRDLENLQTPSGFEQEWEFVKTIWKVFYETHRIDVGSLPCPDSLKNLDRQIILWKSDDVRKYISNIKDYVCPEEEIGSLSVPMTCGQNDTKIAKNTDVVDAVHQDRKNDLLSNVVESLKSKGASSKRQDRKKGKKRSLLEKVPETDTRSVIQNRYVDLINCVLTTANTIDSLHGHNSTFAKIKTAFFTRLEGLLEKAEKEMIHTLQHTVWDNLVVAFFGETNAGKSTIIETFRILYNEKRKESLIASQSEGTDGIIVGDGRADFTKVYEEYPMRIDGKPFTLIDVPGIEGNEEDFIDDIKKALAQAHLVFYVQGHNIKPDVATASKIKKYLGDWVNVYSVYNVRGGAFNYRNAEQRSRLIYGETEQVESLIKDSFTQILGDVYKGNISLQALLALCAVANFSPTRQNLKDTQTKVIKQFGSSSNLLKFSHFNDITSLISEKASNFNEEIVEANKQKLMSLGNFFVSAIDEELKDQSENIEKFSDELKTYGREVSNIYAGTKNSLKNRLFAKCDILFSQLQRDINEVIDINRSNSDIENGINELCNEFSSRFENNMTSIIEEELDNMGEKLKKKQKSLDCYKSLIEDIYYEDINPNVDIDLSDALSRMSISFGDVLSTAGGAAIGAGIGALFGGIGAIPGALIGSGLDLLRKSVFGDGGKSDAKKEIKDELRKAKDKTKLILNGVCDSVNSRISNVTTSTSKKIKDDLEGLRVISTTLDSTKKSLQDSMKNINTTSYGEI